MIVISIVIGVLGIVPKRLILSLEDLDIRAQVEIIQIPAILKSARIIWRVQDTCGNLSSLKLQ